MPRLDREAVRAASPIEAIVAELTGQPIHGGNGAELKFHCPFHGTDKNPSLRVNVGKQNYFCDVCSFGGDVFDFVARSRDCDFKAALKFLAERAGIGSNGASSPRTEPTGEWIYHDFDGAPQYKVQRFDLPGGKKTFKQLRADRRLDGSVAWVGGTGIMTNVERVLYRLPDLRGKKTVYVVEGEGCADALWKIGCAATTAPGGAGKWISDKFPIALGGYAQQLRAAGVQNVVVLPDNDDAGRRHAGDVARTCFKEGVPCT